MKFGVARFDYDGQFSVALDGEASDEWASRFLFICLIPSFIATFDAVAPFLRTKIKENITHKEYL